MNTSLKNAGIRENENPEANASGQLRATDRFGEPSLVDEAPATRAHGAVRKGAVWGGWLGLIFGGAVMVVAVMIGALVGASIGKATELRVEKGSAPRIHFSKASAEQRNRRAA